MSFAVSTATMGQGSYPNTRKTDQVDDYHGVKVADPYRWLEDDNSAETKAWVEAQNKVTFDFLNKIPYRAQMKKRLEELANYPKYSAPDRNGEYYYFYKNDGLQNQAVLYRQKGLDAAPELVMDPNKLSAEGTTSLAYFNLSKDGKYAAWGISKGGSDWRTLYVRDMETGKDLTDSILWVKVSGLDWQGKGFYYSRYPAPEKGKELSSKNENHQVWFHTVGTPQEQDELVYEDKANPQRFHFLSTSEDERLAYLSISDRGKGFDGNALYYRDSKGGDNTFRPIVAAVGKFTYSPIDNDGDKILLFTNDGAEKNKVVLFDPANPAKENWKVIIPEQKEPIQNVGTAGGRLYVSYLKDVTTRVYEYDYSGKLIREIKLPGVGTAGGFGGKKEDKFFFYTFTSFTFPPTIYTYDIATGTSTVFRRPEVAFNPEDYETKQVFYTSKDGTKVPMFIVHKKGLKLDGNNPTMLYAYGGFNISMLPSFSSTLIPWLEQGAVYAVANLRGGAEYGEAWHESGMLFKKQNVFDDFIAAGEYLIKEKYTSSKRLAIRGGSNGGLLVGAVMNQRPDLFKVAIPQVGVMDMLRFHKFTIGWNWIAEYGSSDSADHFKNLYAYSPIHNLKPGLQYPATMITTADHDDRVVPAHSFKYAATLQAMHKGSNPVMIRIDTNSGHGASNTAKALEGIADIYCFTFSNMNFTPKFKTGTGDGGQKKGF
ncbi:prolyl oligopeptidase family serine peptidase [Paraflavitalea sp. CAU 1676]|uniref:prolyl oligopeptidase family serine peptidase n=1 Tax=Paraflavitalea sp. CAU 1676 TaxID=3032598 RepID=UPI0023DC05DA|nr:prolyl oligopeptidase family serine peptidase [Paraflavitalea sp. CAU 1676]MDF2193412.1 prolyl oligopeptidase family serine peptidase [Paraflavitalea sp. CAU 1676]